MLKLDHNQQFELEPDEFYGQEAQRTPIFPSSSTDFVKTNQCLTGCCALFDRKRRNSPINLFARRNVYQFSVSVFRVLDCS
jgi:hypothetical protein